MENKTIGMTGHISYLISLVRKDRIKKKKAISKDEKYIATGDRDSSIRVFPILHPFELKLICTGQSG